MPNKSQFFLALCYAGLAIFSAISIYYITFFHVSPLSRDQWHMYAEYFQHGLLRAAFTPMSTHRHIFPFFIFHLDMSLFGGRNHFLIFIGSHFDGLIIALLLFVLKKEAMLTHFEKQAFAIFSITLLLWLIDIAQLGWGFMSTQYYLAIFSCLFSVYAFYQYCNILPFPNNRCWLYTSIICGVICTFSFGMGILVWPILLFFFWTWRVRTALFLAIGTSFIFCLLFFFLLPGGNSISEALLFSPQHTLVFLFELAGGPIYYFLRSYRLLDTDLIKTIASYIGIFASATGMLILFIQLKKRSRASLFVTCCITFMLLGLGTAALISFTRNPFFLDIWVDRYQIWAVLFWLGFLPLCYLELQNRLSISKPAIRSILILLCSMPILALPSQLDMGARLAEYKIRVQQALLSYQVGIPDKRAAEEALHWNWENKLQDFFAVLPYLKAGHKNIYYADYSQYLGKNISELHLIQQPQKPSLRIKAIEKIKREDLLSPEQLETSVDLQTPQVNSLPDITGYQLSLIVNSDMDWDYALLVNEQGVVNGLGIKINHSILPRSQLKYIRADYNLFAITQGEAGSKVYLYLFNRDRLNEVQLSDAVELY